jgi:hypothetical protein
MSENIGSIYPTKIPGYEEPADIQAALKLYHYGTTNNISTEADIVANSVVGYIKALDTRLDAVETIGVGSTYQSTEPTTLADGLIWMDSDDTLGTIPGLIAAYQTSAPSAPVVGTIWVDSTNESALSLKVYNGTTWKVIV